MSGFGGFGDKLSKGFDQFKQYAGEKLGTAEVTELPREFVELEKSTDSWKAAVESLTKAIKAYLQPDPTLMVQSSLVGVAEKIGVESTRLSSKWKEVPKSAVEALGRTMIQQGLAIGDGSAFGSAVIRCGEIEDQVGQARKELCAEIENGILKFFSSSFERAYERAAISRKAVHQARLELDACKAALKSARPERFQQVHEDLTQAQRTLDRLLPDAIRDMKVVVNNVGTQALPSLSAMINSQMNYFKVAYELFAELAPEIDAIRVTEDAIAAETVHQ